MTPDPETGEDPRLADLPGRYLRSLLRFALILVPEYFLAVFAVGLFTAWGADLPALSARGGVLVLLAVALVGTLLVIPTAGEIPVVLALLAAGAGAGPAGVLLVTLPALSVPSMVMVARALHWRTTVLSAVGVLGGGLLAGGVLAVLL